MGAGHIRLFVCENLCPAILLQVSQNVQQQKEDGSMKIFTKQGMMKIVLAVALMLFCGRLHAGQPTSEPKQLEVDKNMCVGGVPIFIPSFRIEGSNVVFSGGDFRNTVLDFRKADVEVLGLAQVFSKIGCFGTGSEKHYNILVLMDDKDRRLYFDQDWICYPGTIRKIQSGGPFARIDVQCTRGGKEIPGVDVEIGNIRGQTGINGWVTLELKGIQSQILPVGIAGTKLARTIASKIAVPIASAVPGVVIYKALIFDLPEK